MGVLCELFWDYAANSIPQLRQPAEPYRMLVIKKLYVPPHNRYE